MTDHVPIAPPGVPPGDGAVWLTALAKAAAEMAAQQAGQAKGEPLTVEAVEEIAERVAREVVAAVFGDFDVDLDDKASKRGFRDDLSHARRAREWWGKAGQILFTTAATLLSGGLCAAVVKYLAFGGAK